MNRTIINPWTWQDNLGYAQAVEVKGVEGTLYCAGQAAMNTDGVPVGGPMTEQIQLSLANLQTVVKQAGYSPTNIVRLNFYTISVVSFFESFATVITQLKQWDCTPAATLVEVSALAFPELAIELEATVVK